MSKTAHAKLHLISYLWPALIAVLLLLQVIFPYRGWLVLLLGFGGAWIFSYLYARSLLHKVRIIREKRFGWAKVGDVLEERLILVNDGWASATWIAVIDHSDIPGSQSNVVTGVNAHSSNSWVFQLMCARRGLYTIGPTSLETGDLFGIYRVIIQNPMSTVLLVTPPVLPLPAIQVAGGGRAGEGRPAKKALEQSSSVNGVRDYVSGESLRRIHWPTSARREHLFIKTFDHTPISDWWVVLDLDNRVQYLAGSNSTEETGVTLAASLADRGLKAGIAVGLVVSGQEPVWHTPETGAAQNIKIMQSLAQVAPGSQSIQEVMKYVASSLHHQSSLILITSDISASWLDSVLLLLQREIIPTILLLDPQSFGANGSANPLATELTNLGIHCFIITPEIVNLPALIEKQTNIWQWRTLGTGRVIPLHQPDDTRWKSLS